MDGTLVGCYKLIPCPHCGKEYSSNKFPHHVRICVDAPGTRDAIAAALESDTPGVGILEAEYRLISRGLGIPARSTLTRRYGTWGAVLAAFGLRYPQRNAPRTYTATTVTPRATLAQKEALAIADVAQLEADARRTLAAEYDAAHTLHGYRVHDAPGLRVNGRPCVRVELR